MPHDDIGAMTEVFASRGERIAIGGAASHEALNNAAAQRGDVAGCILHTDQHTGEQLRHLTLDPTRDYQPQNAKD